MFEFTKGEERFLKIYFAPIIFLGWILTPFFDWQDRRDAKKFQKWLDSRKTT